MWQKIFPLVVVCLFLTVTGPAQNSLKVDEAGTKAVILQNRLQTNLVLDNKTPGFPAKIRLEVLDTEEKVIANTETAETIKRGRQTLPFSLDLPQQQDEKSLLWNRLRYTIIPDKSDILPITGIVSLSEIMPEIFELRASATRNVFAGMNYRLRVRAFHPVTNLPTAGVRINAQIELEIDDESGKDKLHLAAAGITDSNGYAVIDFKIPENARLDDDGEVKITGEKNGVVREADEDLNALEVQNSVFLTTDKPIYQPNQNFYVRGLFMSQNGTSNQVLAGKELEFTIEDEDDTVLYRETVKTSRFGVASVGWKIPENARLGTYTVKIDSDEDLAADQIRFKVSRYDLPEFTVAAKADKTFYLPGDNQAEITVSADYLFGKAVEKGRVKVVRETDRHWNYKEQKWEVEEEKPFEGETDESGKFVVRVDLTKAHADLKAEEYSRFEDLRFAAYYTDSSTNRTEQKRFDIRVSKDAIHVYLVGVNSYDEHNPKLPVDFYVSTFYADGVPAACNVEIKGKYADEKDAETKTLTRLKTNLFGAGHAVFTLPLRTDENYSEDLQIKVVASDAAGKNGAQEEEIDIDADAKEIQIRVPKTVYRPGEVINAEIVSTELDADVFVDVAGNMSVVESRLVRLKNGRARVAIPFNPKFAGELTVAAYIDDGNESAIRDAAGIIFPHPNNLKLDLKTIKDVFRPNEEASVNFNVKSPGEKPSETALGVVVFDKAIEERARTDAEFGGDRIDQFNGLLGLLDEGLNQIDVSKPVSADLQMKAALLLADKSYYPNFFESDYYGANLKTTFAVFFKKQFDPIETALKNTYEKNFAHPVDDRSLQNILAASGIDFANLRDPWGTVYLAKFAVERDEDAVYFWSAGANKTFGDKDDFLISSVKFKYFTPVGNAITLAALNYYKRTNLYVRDYATLRDELKKQAIDLDDLKDRFNRPYEIKFNVSGRFFTIDVKSYGADGKLDTNYGDDFAVWTSRVDYFSDTEAKIQAVLNNYTNDKKSFPKDAVEFKEILKNGGIDFDSLRDGWNQSLRLELAISSRYADKVKTEVVGKFGEKATEKLIIIPVTQQVAVFRLRSAGADGKVQNYDDFDLTTFSGVLSEQSKTDAKPVELKTETIFTGGKGAVRGTIRDPNGAVIPNVSITALNEETQEKFSISSNEDGIYLLANLPSGKYTIRAESGGFQTYVVQNVPVRSSTISELNFEMNVGGTSQTVEVTAGADQTQTSSSSISSSQVESLPLNGRNFQSLVALKPGVAAGKNKVNLLEETATPRLREYFPETLLWNPELVTDKNGRARLKFNLADNLTTWKLYAIGSNADGKIGIASKEIKTFQPFFVNLEPPKILTVGDEIGLPVQIRNYTEKQQKVSVSMARGDWFSSLTAANQTIDVLPNQTQNAIFGFRADSPTKDGKQRVTAIAAKDSDAIEKPVVVHPNGKEIVRTQSDIFRESSAFDVNFPANILPKTQTARVKIYPNLMSHVAESIEGLLKRPYGCGEQTVSSTYPNLMILKVARNSKSALAPKLQAQAQKFLRQGYERLLGYQNANGGFSVWTQDAPDAALTAYAIRFLTDARDFIDVDADVIARANKWLLAQQRADGSWTRQYSWEKVEDKQRTKILTTYIARVLAMTEKDAKEKSKDAQAALQKAFDYLKRRNDEIDEPFALASFALALFDTGDAKTARAIVGKLETMAIIEGDRAYWNLETNTPFYGWGTAGRIETTALVVQALEKFKVQSSKFKAEDGKAESVEQNRKTADLIAKGTAFLLKNKDRYGVWYSTQATVNVLDAIIAVVVDSADANEQGNRTAEISVNNQKARDVALPAPNVLAYPLEIDLPAALLAASDNRVEIKIGGNRSAAMAQIVATHYVSWSDFAASGRDVNQSRQLRLDYSCDKRGAAIMQEINCRVEAERIGFRGYGMLLAEIGLPPGVEVDRASLEKAKEANQNFSRYDVLPDKIVVYMWAQAGGVNINFKFRQRYAINAQTAPSIVYDYYNAEAEATVAPLKFSIK